METQVELCYYLICNFFNLKVIKPEHIHIPVNIDAAHICGIAKKRYVYKLYKLVSVKVQEYISACFIRMLICVVVTIINNTNTNKLIFTVYVIRFIFS